MALGEYQSGEGPRIPAGRRAMLATHAALNSEFRTALEAFDVTFRDDELDPYAQLAAAVENRAGSPADVPRLQLAHAAQAVLRADREQPREDRAAVLEPVLVELVEPALRGDTDRESAADAVHTALGHASGAESADWLPELVDRAGPDLLHPDLRRVGTSQLRLVGGDEYASRIEVRFEVRDPGNVGLDEVAPRVVPDRWPRFNDFFCSLTPTDRDRDRLAAGRAPVEPSADARSWQRVYLERVGACPGGWFPDTFLLFTWSRSEAQLVLYYELDERRPGDRTQLSIDDGFIQIDQLPGRYDVTAVKTLLFDDERVPSGGQLLAKYAFELGWFDHAINWFSIDAGTTDGAQDEAPAPLAPPPSSSDSEPAGMDAEVQDVLNKCEADVRSALSEVDGQWSAAVQRIRGGRYGLDACVQDWAKVADRAIRYGARSVGHQVSLAKALDPRRFTTS